MAKLDGTNVLTLNTNETDGGTPTFASQNITVKTSADYSSLTLTTIPSGVYLIQYKAGGSYNTEKVGSYVFANLAGYFGWAAQARRVQAYAGFSMGSREERYIFYCADLNYEP